MTIQEVIMDLEKALANAKESEDTHSYLLGCLEATIRIAIMNLKDVQRGPQRL